MKDESKSHLEALQQDYSKSKRYLEWASILAVFCRNEDISVDLTPLIKTLKDKVNDLESSIPNFAVKLKTSEKKVPTKKEKVNPNPSKEKDHQSIENLKFHYENHNRENELPLLYHPEKNLLITRSPSQLTLYQAGNLDIQLKGRTFQIKDSSSIKETALIQKKDLTINQIKETLAKADLGFNLDLGDLDIKFCLIMGRI